MRVQIYTNINMNVHINKYTIAYLPIHKCRSTGIYIYIYIYTHTTYIHTDTEIHRYTSCCLSMITNIQTAFVIIFYFNKFMLSSF